MVLSIADMRSQASFDDPLEGLKQQRPRGSAEGARKDCSGTIWGTVEV